MDEEKTTDVVRLARIEALEEAAALCDEATASPIRDLGTGGK